MIEAIFCGEALAKTIKKFRDENMELFIKIWKNLPSLVALVLPLIIEYYYRKIDAKNEKIRRESEEEEKRIMEKEREHNDRERRIQWTLEAYTKLYETALYKLESYGTGTEIKERNFKRQDKEYKQLRSYIDRIETFAKGFGLVDGEKIYDIDTFKQVATPYFGLIIKPRINAFFESVGSTDQSYSDIKRLLEKI